MTTQQRRLYRMFSMTGKLIRNQLKRIWLIVLRILFRICVITKDPHGFYSGNFHKSDKRDLNQQLFCSNNSFVQKSYFCTHLRCFYKNSYIILQGFACLYLCVKYKFVCVCVVCGEEK